MNQRTPYSKIVAAVVAVLFLLISHAFAWVYITEPTAGGGLFAIDVSYAGVAPMFWGHASVIDLDSHTEVASADFWINATNNEGEMDVSYGGEHYVNRNISYDYGWLVGVLYDFPVGNYQIVYEFDVGGDYNSSQSYWLTLGGG